MSGFLSTIRREDLLNELLVLDEWHKIVAKTHAELKQSKRTSLKEFRLAEWMDGGLFGDVVNDPGTVAPLVATATNRAYLPVWNNAVFAAPCQHSCPIGIPTQERINLLRKGKVREALELVLQYIPFPGSVCGSACPNPCMAGCTRQYIDFSVLAGPLGKYSTELPAPPVAPRTGRKFAIIGSGVGGLSAAWQLALKGHEVTIYERSSALGGKMTQAIPHERLNKDIVQTEIRRILSLGVKVEYNYKITREKFEKIRKSHDGVVIAIGTSKPRMLEFKGSEKTVSALEYLTSSNMDQPVVDVEGRNVVVIGAGDVGMDVCTIAWQRGASSVMAVDIQEPASSSRERAAAMALGTQVLWPRVVHSFDDGKVLLEKGETIPADVVIISIGETPESEWIPENIIRTKSLWLSVDEYGQTSDPKVYAVGDAVKPGLLAEAIGQGRMTALSMHAHAMEEAFELPRKQPISIDRLKLIYFTPREKQIPTDPLTEAERCISCGTCRDCNICVYICGQNAITRQELANGAFEFRVDEEHCIGCGFCAAACPSGIWTMIPNQQYIGESV
jgi:NADPH-dependent glutamate synthase beta subunit-like oxidoreductase/Pyruvate/2-oxoacid:ferredoxin oxidoreductase delta subunit